MLPLLTAIITAPEPLPDEWWHNPLYIFITGSIFIGACITTAIAVRRDILWLFITSVITVIASVITGTTLASVYFSHLEDQEQRQQLQAEQEAEQTLQDEETRMYDEARNNLELDLSNKYQIVISDDLADALIANLTTEELSSGMGEGIVWRGNSENYLINNTVYELQLVWAGEEWMLVNLLEETTPGTLPELTLTGN